MAGSAAGPRGKRDGAVEELPAQSGKPGWERFETQASRPPETSKAVKEE